MREGHHYFNEGWFSLKVLAQATERKKGLTYCKGTHPFKQTLYP